MKLTKRDVEFFEQEQRQYGTKVALFNFLFLVFREPLKQLVGEKRLRIQVKDK